MSDSRALLERVLSRSGAALHVSMDDLLASEPGFFPAPVVQFLKPYGDKRLMTCPMPEELRPSVELMDLSAEVTSIGLAVYARWLDEDEEAEEMDLAENVAGGPNNPQAVLERLIRKRIAARGR